MTRWIITALALTLSMVSAAAGVVPSAVLEAQAQRVKAVAKASPAVLAIFGSAGDGGGSGVVISPDGYALSNFHVTRPSGDAMKCGMADGMLYDAVIVGIDPTGDVALIKVLGRDDFPYAEMADSDTVEVGDWVYAMGNPFLLATDFQPSVSYGVVSGVHRYQYPAGTLLEYADCIQTDSSINPGNSGGPLFNADGLLIGINGRGSFEKRGRVNVGVGYAISINQIKNFLGHLKAGRVVDHATLGARMGTDSNGRVVVTDILEHSDAYRRGLRYDDEILSFGGRPVSSVNAFKNILGIFPQGWRVPLVFRHDDERTETFVRLRGVHRVGELAELITGRTPVPPGPKKPGDKDPDAPNPDSPKPGSEEPKSETPEPKDEQPRERPRGRRPSARRPAERPIPQIVKDQLEPRAGYANYHFNKLERDRVWKSHLARGDFAAATGAWILTGVQSGGTEASFAFTNELASITLPGGEAKLSAAETMGDDLSPPRSGGLLLAMHLWRRLLVEGPSEYGLVHYLGAAPLPGRNGLVDVLIGTHAGVDCWFYFDPVDGYLLAMEMFPEADVDPCEVYFGDYKDIDGRLVPHRIEVRYGDEIYDVFTFKKFEFQKGDES